MSHKGNPCDNAVAEHFFSCLKYELIHLKQYPTQASAKADVFACLEAYYNMVRPHSALGWLTPAQFEAYHLASLRYMNDLPAEVHIFILLFR